MCAAHAFAHYYYVRRYVCVSPLSNWSGRNFDICAPRREWMLRHGKDAIDLNECAAATCFSLTLCVSFRVTAVDKRIGKGTPGSRKIDFNDENLFN